MYVYVEIEEEICTADSSNDNMKLTTAGSPEPDGAGYIDDFEDDSEAEV